MATMTDTLPSTVNESGGSSGPSGPLRGLRILEFAAIGPVAFCGMQFSDLGADVLRIDRPGGEPIDRYTLENRGRRSVVLDLKSHEGCEAALQLIQAADGIIEGHRPGVMERLGLGPDVALARNSRLVYGRMTGWGQSGPYAQMAGHDINYIALSGALHAIGPAERPSIPLNLIADFGGGALFLSFGMLAALLHARATGEGQVVDCAMNEGTTSLLTLIYGHLARGTWQDRRASNIIDGGAHFYNVYQCADGEWVAFAAMEPQFYAELIRRAGVTDPTFAVQHDSVRWPELRERLAAIIKTRTRAQWCTLMEGTDACFAPVLKLREAPGHPHNLARNAFVEVDEITQPAPAPRFSRTPGRIQGGAVAAGAHQESALRDWGVNAQLIESILQAQSTGERRG